jgi:DNA-binding transcriptional regulator YdaS (Cro superfamily)
MPDQRKKITPGQFSSRLQAVLGDGYEKAMAEAIGVSLSTVYRWCAGDVPVPQYAVAIVEFLEALPKAFRPPRWTRE